VRPHRQRAPARVSTQRFIVLNMADSRSNYLGAQVHRARLTPTRVFFFFFFFFFFHASMVLLRRRRAPARVSTKSFVVLNIGNSKSSHIGAQGTFNPNPVIFFFVSLISYDSHHIRQKLRGEPRNSASAEGLTVARRQRILF